MQKYWLNYHHLLYFMTIAIEGSVAKASTKLKLGQSTLSTQLGQFEDHLGIKLFERRRQRLHLTEAGNIALQYAREIFKVGDEMLDTLHDRRQAHRISVQVGAMDSVPKSFVVELVNAAQKNIPCTLSFIEGQADELLGAVRAHEIDLALLTHQPTAAESSRISSRLVSRQPIVILGTKKFADLKNNFPRSLQDQPFVMPSARLRLRHDVDLFLKREEISIDRVLEAQDASLLTLFAMQGHGLIPVSSAVAEDLQKQQGLVLIGALEDVFDDLWIVKSERRIENPVGSYLFKNFRLL